MKQEVLNKVEEHLEDFKKNYPTTEWVGIFLQGSQNYQLDYEDSDVDTKLITLPSKEDFVRVKNPMSFTHIRGNNEHIDLKDIRTMMNTFKKQNINFIEVLFTDYMILNPKYEELFMPLIENKERVARYDIYTALNCMVGMACQKHKALEHPYPTIVHKIEKYGYDPKQLHHILRMVDFIDRYCQGEKYEKCLVPTDREYLIEVKKGYYSLEEARTLADNELEIVKGLRDNYVSKNKNIIDDGIALIMEEITLEILKKSFIEQLLNK